MTGPTPLELTIREHVPEARACWRAALARRTVHVNPTARVNITFDVSLEGMPLNVTASDDPTEYPGLAGCLLNEVRAWHLCAGPAYHVYVPFVYAGGERSRRGLFGP